MVCRYTTFILFFLLLLASCSGVKKTATYKPVTTTKPDSKPTVSKFKTFTKPLRIDRKAFVSFAKTLLGTPYKYGSAVPEKGFDCSGFISYVFSHFNVKAPRSSVDFTNEGKEIEIKDARPGDIILFTGSDNSTGIVGHMGIITSNSNTPQFIHSASGKNVGVILSNLTGYYKTHFVKVIRILE
jgi:cell wall-associated NlpC family hydrolase